jgi:hypothetical protein
MRKLPSAAVSQTTSGRANAIGRIGDFFEVGSGAIVPIGRRSFASPIG